MAFVSRGQLRQLAKLQELYADEAALATHLYATVRSLLDEAAPAPAAVPRAVLAALDAAVEAGEEPTLAQASLLAATPDDEGPVQDCTGLGAAGPGRCRDLDVPRLYAALQTTTAYLVHKIDRVRDEPAQYVLRPLGGRREDVAAAGAAVLPTCSILRRAALADQGRAGAWCFFQLTLGGVVDLPRGFLRWQPQDAAPSQVASLVRAWTQGLGAPGPQPPERPPPAVELVGDVCAALHSQQSLQVTEAAGRVAHAADLANVVLELYRGPADGAPQTYGYPPGLRSWAVPAQAEAAQAALHETWTRALDTNHAALWPSDVRPQAARVLEQARPLALARAERCLAWQPGAEASAADLMTHWGWTAQLQERLQWLLHLRKPGLAALERTVARFEAELPPRPREQWQQARQARRTGPQLAATYLVLLRNVLDGTAEDPLDERLWPRPRRPPDELRPTSTDEVPTPYLPAVSCARLLDEAKRLEARLHIDVGQDVKHELAHMPELCAVSNIGQAFGEPADATAAAILADETLQAKLGFAALPLQLAAFLLRQAFAPAFLEGTGLTQPERVAARQQAVALLRTHLRFPADLATALRQAQQVLQQGPEPERVRGGRNDRAHAYYVAWIVHVLAAGLPSEGTPSAAAALASLVLQRPRAVGSRPAADVLRCLASCSVSRFADQLPATVPNCRVSLRSELDAEACAVAVAGEAQLLAALHGDAARQSAVYAAALRSMTKWTALADRAARPTVAVALYLAQALLPAAVPGVAPPNWNRGVAIGAGLAAADVQAELQLAVLPPRFAASQQGLNTLVVAADAVLAVHFTEDGAPDDAGEHLADMQAFLQTGGLVLLRLAATPAQVGTLQDLAAKSQATLLDWRPAPAYVAFERHTAAAPRHEDPGSLDDVRRRVQAAAEAAPAALPASYQLHIWGAPSLQLVLQHVARSLVARSLVAEQSSPAPTYRETRRGCELVYSADTPRAIERVSTAWQRAMRDQEVPWQAAHAPEAPGAPAGCYYSQHDVPGLDDVLHGDFEGAMLGTLWFLDALRARSEGTSWVPAGEPADLPRAAVSFYLGALPPELPAHATCAYACGALWNADAEGATPARAEALTQKLIKYPPTSQEELDAWAADVQRQTGTQRAVRINVYVYASWDAFCAAQAGPGAAPALQSHAPGAVLRPCILNLAQLGDAFHPLWPRHM